MHDLLGGLSQLALQLHAADGGDAATIKASLIAGLSLLCATCITAAATTYQRSRQPEPAPAVDVLAVELRRRAETAESQLDSALSRIDVLETLCWDNHINPHTGRSTG